jgi:hypothetical protein
MNKDINFIRKNGRIIPIHKKQSNYTNIMKKSGAYEFGSAAAVTSGGAYLARQLRARSFRDLVWAEKGFRIKNQALEKGNIRAALKLGKYVSLKGTKPLLK